eukprot:TRINITY_DN19788_c0_g1_i1.p1 TRINITY_DN19788_c0_g1~~TRINITY_DN19788_c0_g1_i1.p1  ORF type:complete len:159 (+),score=37.39 TRINITY_DN19788_c0_g1_i1:135-611(+)
MNMGGDNDKSNNSREGEEEIEEDDGDDDEGEDIFRIRIEGGGEEKDKKKKERRQLLEAFGNSFLQVQTVLDQNRALITQVNDNHQSKLPENLSRNVALIRQINANIAKAVSIYSDLSANFSNIFQHHGRPRSSSSSEGDSSNRLQTSTVPDLTHSRKQ